MSDEVMQDNMQDNKNPWNADLTDPMLRLRLASERLSIVRYVFLVQVEDGIASADERASLEYADADKEQPAEKQAEQQADGAQKSGASA